MGSMTPAWGAYGRPLTKAPGRGATYRAGGGPLPWPLIWLRPEVTLGLLIVVTLANLSEVMRTPLGLSPYFVALGLATLSLLIEAARGRTSLIWSPVFLLGLL